MRAEEFLTKPKRLKDEIRRQEMLADAIRESVMPRGVSYDEDKVKASPEDPMPRMMARLDEKLEAIKRLRAELARCEAEIDRVVASLPEGKERMVITSWYILDLGEIETCENLELARTKMYEIKAAALEHIEEKLRTIAD